MLHAKYVGINRLSWLRMDFNLGLLVLVQHLKHHIMPTVYTAICMNASGGFFFPLVI